MRGGTGKGNLGEKIVPRGRNPLSKGSSRCGLREAFGDLANPVRTAGGRKHPSICLSLGFGFVKLNRMGIWSLRPWQGSSPP